MKEVCQPWWSWWRMPGRNAGRGIIKYSYGVKQAANILIVDDNEDLLVALRIFLSRHFNTIDTLKNPNVILSEMRRKSYDIILLDMNFKAGQTTGNEGIFWLSKILEADPDATVVFITAYGDVELAIKSMKEGAADFILKSWDEQKIVSTIMAAYQLRKSKMEVSLLRKKQAHLTREIDKDYSVCYGPSPAIKELLDTIGKIATTDASVLLLGENGTGKEVIAREIHRLSARQKEVFIKVDLGSLPPSLFESELFGHEKGAFTDAKEARDGRFIIASGGTLFLDEIGNLPVDLQGKLLSAIQNKEVYPVGSTVPVRTNIRLISATNMPLEDMIKQGSFREDLFYRINVIQLEIPALRNRREDIPVMAEFFLSKFREQYNKVEMTLSKEASKKLREHSWPGNIRELEHTMEKAVILSDGKSILPDHLFSPHTAKKSPVADDNFNLEDHERDVIARAVRRHKGNLSLAAKKLGINRSTLYAKMKRYGI